MRRVLMAMAVLIGIKALTMTGGKTSGSRLLALNNPAGLKYHSIGWKGETGSDGTFSKFDTLDNGIRAMLINATTQIDRGHNTIEKFITRWAPKFENPTNNYIEFVTIYTGFKKDYIILPYMLPSVMAAVVLFENGQRGSDNYKFWLNKITAKYQELRNKNRI